MRPRRRGAGRRSQSEFRKFSGALSPHAPRAQRLKQARLLTFRRQRPHTHMRARAARSCPISTAVEQYSPRPLTEVRALRLQCQHATDIGVAATSNRRKEFRSSLRFLVAVSTAILCSHEAYASTPTQNPRAAFAALLPQGLLPLSTLAQPSLRCSRPGGAPFSAKFIAKCALGYSRTGALGRRGLGFGVGGGSASRRGGALNMVFLPDNYKGASDDDDAEASGSGSSESSESEWDDRNAIIRAYSPITGTTLETPSELNEKLRPTGLTRHRLTMAPDEAFGCIFRLEGALLDTTELHRTAWTQVVLVSRARLSSSRIVSCRLSLPVLFPGALSFSCSSLPFTVPAPRSRLLCPSPLPPPLLIPSLPPSFHACMLSSHSWSPSAILALALSIALVGALRLKLLWALAQGKVQTWGSGSGRVLVCATARHAFITA